MDANITSEPLADSTLPGFLDSWTMTVRSTKPNQSNSVFTVQFVVFESVVFIYPKFSKLSWLWWPKQMENCVSSRQAEFVFGRLAARNALIHLSSTLADTLIPVGKDREPVWPDTVLGSISHTDGLAGAAVVSTGLWHYLGIDLEQTAFNNAQRALRTSVINSAEFAMLKNICNAAGQFNLDAHITHIFSAKECLYKAAFPSVRRFFGFSDARLCAYELLLAGGPEVRLALEITEEIGGEFIAGSQWWIEIWRLPNLDIYLSVLAY